MSFDEWCTENKDNLTALTAPPVLYWDLYWLEAAYNAGYDAGKDDYTEIT